MRLVIQPTVEPSQQQKIAETDPDSSEWSWRQGLIHKWTRERERERERKKERDREREREIDRKKKTKTMNSWGSACGLEKSVV